MTIDEATKELQREKDEWLPGENDKWVNALGLGIEALKRVKLEHERNGVKVKWLLPEETEE